MGLVQDGIGNAVRQDIDPVRQVGGKEGRLDRAAWSCQVLLIEEG